MIEFNKLQKIKKIDDAYWDNGLYVFLNEDDNPVQVKLPTWMKKALDDLMKQSYSAGYGEAQKNVQRSMGL